MCLVDDDGPVVTPLEAEVVVVGVEESSDNRACQSIGDYGIGVGTRLMLEAANGEQWTLFVRMPGLPLNFANVEDTFTLSLTPIANFRLGDSPNQTIVMSSSNGFALFADTASYELNPSGGLEPIGVTVSDGGELCRMSALIGPCAPVYRRVRVTVNGEEAEFEPYQTQTVAGAVVTVDEAFIPFAEMSCDGVSFRQVAGIFPPP
jgi:hypothetical protein